MAQKRLIARAGQGLLNGSKLLLRGVAALCSAFGSLLLAFASQYDPADDAPGSYMGEYDPMKPLGAAGRRVSHSQAEEYDYENW